MWVIVSSLILGVIVVCSVFRFSVLLGVILVMWMVVLVCCVISCYGMMLVWCFMCDIRIMLLVFSRGSVYEYVIRLMVKVVLLYSIRLLGCMLRKCVSVLCVFL